LPAVSKGEQLYQNKGKRGKQIARCFKGRAALSEQRETREAIPFVRMLL
jgi:hypothetical protein